MAKINLDIYYKYRDVLGDEEAMKLCKEDQKKRTQTPPPSPDLFLPPMPETGHGAASKIDSYYSLTGVYLSECQEKVYRGYHELGAVTDCEMEEAVGVDKNIVNARRNELMSKGLVEFAYKKYNEKTRKYNNAYRLKGN